MTINRLIDIVERIAGIEMERKHDLAAPRGPGARNSDNTSIQRELGWRPSTRPEDGLVRTYAWIAENLASNCA